MQALVGLLLLAAIQSPHGSVRGDAFFAPSLGVQKHLMVYLPPSYATNPTRRYPVAYYLHGLSGTETDWLSRAGIDAIADSLIGAGLPEMIIVMPDGDDSWYTAPATPMPYAACRDSIRSESPERGCVKSSHYDEYIARDLVQYVDAHYRTLADRPHRGVGGLSMGGYGAIKLALQFPDVFAAAASHSGVLSPRLIGPNPFTLPPQYAASADTLLRLKRAGPTIYGHDLSLWIDNDPAILAARLQKSGRPMPAIYMDVGRSDPYAHENQAFDFELRRLGITHAYHEYSGIHNWRFWSTHVPQSLAWMLSIIGKGTSPP
jgi:S-formylglutathione hydrolase FrmB